MDKIKRFIDCYIPTETCNLRCHYCYIAQKRKFNNKLAKFSYPKEYICEAWTDEQIEAYYDELDANGVNLNEAIIENLETGQNIREAMLNAMRDTDYGSKSLPASGGSE